MKWIIYFVTGLSSALLAGQVPSAQAQENAPTVFQAAGPTIESIQGTVDAFRAALGDPNNANTPGPLLTGRREINWDGGGSTDTSPAPTPFEGFLNRGARFATFGTGFVQAPVEGLATTFNNSSYEAAFQAFSPVRLFSPVGSNVTNIDFFVPGDGTIPARVTGFGAVFSDVDEPNGRRSRDESGGANNRPNTIIQYFAANGRLLFSSAVPASPGDASLSFFGIVFDDPRIARVRITTGDVAPGPDETRRRDIVVMDDFIYGEPQESP